MSFLGSAQGFKTIGAFGNITQGIGDLVSAGQQEKLGEYNANIYEQQAQQQRQGYELLEAQKRKALKSQIGTQTALYAKSGVKLSGSPVDVMLDSLTNAHMDMAIGKYNSEVAARSAENAASVTRYEAKQQASRYRMRAANTFLSTGASFYNPVK